jgi:hypothetical protein
MLRSGFLASGSTRDGFHILKLKMQPQEMLSVTMELRFGGCSHPIGSATFRQVEEAAGIVRGQHVVDGSDPAVR